MENLFGTDGIRGVYGELLTPRFAFRVGRAVASRKDGCKIVLGRDPRKSGQTLAHAFLAGVLSLGGKAEDFGVIPTPAISYLTRKRGADLGVVITASHNEERYNGIKFFGATGEKLTAREEEEITLAFQAEEEELWAVGSVATFSQKEYADSLSDAFPPNALSGLKIALDLARGSASGIAESVFLSLGARVCVTGLSGSGAINDGCGATHPERISALTVQKECDLGFAFDGDADRVVMSDRRGKIYDGDDFLYLLATRFGAEKAVGTVLTNQGVAEALQQKGVEFFRTKVGDRNVAEEMKKRSATLGTEPAGHVLIYPKKTGDGIFVALTLAQGYAEKRGRFSVQRSV